jgi:uncharacterized membrane protein
MKLAGHPIHVMFIHFPAALLPADLVLSFLGHYYNNAGFSQAGFYCLVGGVGIGFIAIVTGLLDLLAIPKTNKEALAAGLTHGFVNGLVIFVYAILAWKSWKNGTYDDVSVSGSVIVKAIMVLTLLFGNYLGGKLIYKYRIGIDKNL